MRARDYAEKWWSNQKEEDPHILRRIITALGAPALVSNLTAMKGAAFIRSDPVLWRSLSIQMVRSSPRWT